MSALRVGMIFGGRSVEHEISVITAQQAIAALPAGSYVPVPIYIAKSGAWYTGDALLQMQTFLDKDFASRLDAVAEQVVLDTTAGSGRLLPARSEKKRWSFGGGRRQGEDAQIDVAFPLIHGSHGEDGTLQGLLELADLPYVGSGVAASAIGIDKALTKTLLKVHGLPVIDHVEVRRGDWQADPGAVERTIGERFQFPLIVKPLSLGSSIGVSHASSAEELRFGLEVALTYDARALVEPAVPELREINCAVLGDAHEARASVCEQPVGGTVLSYADKYMAGGKATGMKSAQRIVPAPLGEETAEAIRATAIAVFRAIGAAGVARVDFLLGAGDRFFVNEINTTPGSLASYLWEHSGLDFPALLRSLIDIALRRHEEKRASTASFDVSLLELGGGASTKSAGGKARPAAAGSTHLP